MVTKRLDLSEINQIVEEGSFDDFIGAIEHEQFECKREPYNLVGNKNAATLELAKDVSSLLNRSGGVILIGVEGDKNQYHAFELVKKVRPFGRSELDCEQYRKLINSWIYPPPKHADVSWFPSQGDPERGVVRIQVPRGEERLRPFLVTKSEKSTGKLAGHTFGYFERVRDDVQHYPVERIHQLTTVRLKVE